MTLAWNREMLAERHKCCGEFERRCLTCNRPILRNGVSIKLVIGVVDEVFGVTQEDLRSRCRHAELVEARAFVSWALRSLGRVRSYPAIGRLIGRDASSAMHLHRRAIEMRLSNNDFDAVCRGFGERWMETGETRHARCH